MGYLEQWGDDGRTCTGCDEFKPWTEFSPRAKGKNGRKSRCRACEAARRRNNRAANLELYRATGRAYDRRTMRHRVRRYGVGREQWDALVAKQEGRCAVCGRLPRRRLVGDHCHKSGRFRGVVCDQCNIAMGQTGDDPVILRKLAAWIEDHA